MPTEALFWTCVILLAYVHVGYPALLWAWARHRPPHADVARAEPSVTVLVVAYNEAGRVADRLRDLLALEYPSDRLEILLASDGSTDGTAEVARGFARANVRVVAFAGRRGKPAVLNDVVPRLRSDIVVLADARQHFDRGALRALVAPFADPRVGVVSGELVLGGQPGSSVGDGVGFYWRYEKLIRASESRVDSVVGATGAIYAIRRTLYETIPDTTLLDDVLIPLTIARHGYRVLFEPGALAYDRVASTAGEEFTRKVRTIAGNFQLFAAHSWLLNPFANRLWFQTVSHKGLRLLGPLLLVGAFATNAALAEQALYRDLLGLQLAFYTAALGGHWCERTRLRVLSVPYVFCLLHWVTVIAFLRFLRGAQRVTWEKTA